MTIAKSLVGRDIQIDGGPDWFEGLAVQIEPNGETRPTGSLSDQAALYGVLAEIHNLNLELVSVGRLSSSEK